MRLASADWSGKKSTFVKSVGKPGWYITGKRGQNEYLIEGTGFLFRLFRGDSPDPQIFKSKRFHSIVIPSLQGRKGFERCYAVDKLRGNCRGITDTGPNDQNLICRIKIQLLQSIDDLKRRDKGLAGSQGDR